MDEFTTMTQETTEQVNETPVVENEGTDFVEEDDFNELTPWDQQLPIVEDTENDSNGIKCAVIGAATAGAALFGGLYCLKRKINKYCDTGLEPKSALMAGLVSFEKKRRFNKQVKAKAKELKKDNDNQAPHVEGEIVNK